MFIPNKMATGFLNLVLHAHMPYIRHPHDPCHFEQKWFYEAVAECYVPMLHMLHGLQRDGVGYHITISLSPTLCALLADGEVRAGFEEYLERQIALCRHETAQGQGLGSYYLEKYREVQRIYRGVFEGDLAGAFVELHHAGRVSLITTAATHCFLPLLDDCPSALAAQVRGGLRLFESMTGIRPSGFWLPECGYSAATEEALAAEGISYSIIDAHGMLLSASPPATGIYRPVTGRHGVVLFGRDADMSRLVWSAESGYPADPVYRDFHDDAVQGMTEEEIKRFVHPSGERIPTGLKYKSITGRGQKETYDPHRALERTAVHASDFVDRLAEALSGASRLFTERPVITLCFDAELFGHWWHEGCEWLGRVLTLISARGEMEMGHYGDGAALTGVAPASSSWGHRGFSETWINPRNDRLLRYIHDAARTVTRLASEYSPPADTGVTGILNGVAREALMLQASDWGFLLNSGISAEYANERVERHYHRVKEMEGWLLNGRPDGKRLAEIERDYGPVMEADIRWFR